jgi:hypothetical protein
MLFVLLKCHLVPEQLKRIHGDMDKIDENLNFADRTIRGMESIWGSVKNMVSKPASTIKYDILALTHFSIIPRRM